MIIEIHTERVVAMTVPNFTIMVIFSLLKAVIPLILIGVIIFLVVTDTNKNKGSAPVQYDVQGRAVVTPKGRFNTSTALLLIGSSFILLSVIAFVCANWVKLQDWGKVLVLLGAAAVSLLISVFLRSTAKLDLTSSAFYIIGVSMLAATLLTAGGYGLFGDWYSLHGSGAAMMWATASLMIAASSLPAYMLYKKKAYIYIGLSFISVSLIFLAAQMTDSFKMFAVLIIMMQFVITFIVHIIKPQKGTILELPVHNVGSVTSVVFAILAFINVSVTTFSADLYTYIILGVIMLECFLFGIIRKQSWLFVISDLTAIYTAFTAAIGLHDKYGTGFAMLFFAFSSLALYLINLSALHSYTAPRGTTFSFAIIGALVSLLANNESCWGMNLIVPIAVSLLIYCFTLHKVLEVQIFAGLSAPIIPLMTAFFLNNRLVGTFGSENKASILTLTLSGFVLISLAATFLLMNLPKLSLEFNEYHPLRTEVPLYSNMVVSGAVLLGLSGYSELSVLAVAVCILHFIVSHFMKCNITAAGSVIGLIIITNRTFGNMFENSEIPMYLMFGLFVLMLVLSRILFPDSFISRKNDREHFDVLLLSSWMCIIGFPFFDRMSFFLRGMAIAAFLAFLIKKNTSKDVTVVLVSLSMCIAAFACFTRILLIIDSSIIGSKMTLGIIVLLGAAYRIILKQHRLASRVISEIMFAVSFIGLIIDAMIYHNAANTIFVLAVTAAILLVAFYSKNKTWFAVSSTALMVITVFSTRKYFATMGWWIYLLIVGLILIAAAAVNEYCRKKDCTIKAAASETFSGWKW